MLLLPFFNVLTGKDLVIWRFGRGLTLLGLGALAVLTGVMSGAYPAFFLSRFKTIPALKGYTGNLSNSILLRKSLVIFQFVITVVMIIGSLIIYQQLQYTSRKDLGFNKHQIVTLHIHDQKAREQVAALKAELLKNNLIRGAAAAGNPIGNNDLGGFGYRFEKEDGSFETNSVICEQLMVDPDYIPTMEITMRNGRNFSAFSPSDKSGAALVNETLVKRMGWKQAVGKRLRFNIEGQDTVGERTIIGVVKDFHTYSLQHKVEPMVMLMPPAAVMEDNLYVKINTARTPEALAYLEAVYKKFDSNNPVDFSFLDQNFARQYGAEQKQEQLSLVFTVLAVSIACLGLFGLATFTTQQRFKEIGIRKVLGASVPGILALLSADFIKLVMTAIVIAVPIAWYAMSRWLADFAYRVELHWWTFALAGFAAMGIALITISLQSLRAALMNPVKALKAE